MRSLLWLAGLVLAGCLPAIDDECGPARPCAAGRCLEGVCLGDATLAPDAEDAAPPRVDAEVEADRGAIPPGCEPAPETCDDRDEDCDGRVDEGLWRPCRVGAPELDGVGVCRAGQARCVAGAWGACEDAVGPRRERCDGEDSDCDGQVDEALDETCYSGPAGTAGQGRCRAGTRACLAGAASPECRGQVLPVPERCDGEDDDCDGRADEGLDCACREGDVRLCAGGAQGACRPGEQRCVGRRWGPCAGAVLPGEEVCNALDDDCDGEVDEGLDGARCVLGVGGCRRVGALACEAGELGCAAPADAGPEAELCNGLDDDCDGRADEDDALGAACTAGLGACEAEGFLRCGVDGDVLCDASLPPPRLERCDGLDDDCDGRVDEGERGQPLRVPCYLGAPDQAGVGECRAGVQACADGLPAGTCQGAVGPTAEICNGRDDDCDGVVDELPEGGCACEPGLTRPCYGGPPGTEGVGACAPGVRTCAPDGRFGACVGERGPAEEACNAVDDDCDGRVDEAVPGAGRGCTAGVGACAREGRLVCAGGALGCDARAASPIAEICNGADDDCDGRVDEQLAGLSQPCTVGVGACEATGVTRCEPGRGVICDGVPQNPRPERCNGADDDCDGLVDEGVQQACGGCEPPPPDTCNGRDDDCDGRVDEAPDPLVGAACRVGVGQCAAEGAYVCGPGGLVCTGQAGLPTEELCNRLDDDCDGVVDDEARCPLAGVVGARCDDGRCRFEACAPGYFDADGVADTGCERGCAIGRDADGVAVADRVVGAGRWARSATGAQGTATSFVDLQGDLIVVAGPNRWRVGAAGMALSWPAIAAVPTGFVVVVRAEGMARAELWRVDLRPGQEARTDVLASPGAGPAAVRALAAGGVAIAWLGDAGAQRALFLARDGEAAQSFPLAGLAGLPASAAPGMLVDADRTWLVVPVLADGALRLQAHVQQGGRLAQVGQADGVGPVQGPLLAARRGAAAQVAYAGGGALRRHVWRLEAEPGLGPALALREGEGVSVGSLVATAEGFIASTAAVAAAGGCQIHLLRDDGGLVGTVPMGRLDCQALSLSPDATPLVTWTDVASRVWATPSGCR
ncbi:MAG: hypothetical protein H6706_20945 [Myxococcales bacterium]|nr:hypothetical protein [Myxococcales bacterium]